MSVGSLVFTFESTHKANKMLGEKGCLILCY